MGASVLGDGVSERDSATRTRDLSTGTPVWLRRGEVHVAAQPLTRDVETEVVVVGGGVSGALAADALLRAGHRVLALDRRGFVTGSTPASTALLQFDLDKPLTHLVRSIGRSRAVRAYLRSATAVDALRHRLLELGLRCGFRERESIYLPGDLLDRHGLRREAEARVELGLSSRYVEAAELRALTGIAEGGAIRSSGAGELDPVAMVVGVWRSATARGAALHAPVDVVDVADGPRHVTLTTRSGHRVRAGRSLGWAVRTSTRSPSTRRSRRSRTTSATGCTGRRSTVVAYPTNPTRSGAVVRSRRG